MTKLLLNFEIDMNDGDYEYGMSVVNKEDWQTFKKHMIDDNQYVYVFAHDLDREFTAENFFGSVCETEITATDFEVLDRLGLSSSGRNFMGVLEEDINEIEKAHNIKLEL